MKVFRSSDPRIVPALLNTTIVELTTSTMSTPTAMSSLGGVTSWLRPKLLILLACAVPANPVRLSGGTGVVSGVAALAVFENAPGCADPPGTALAEASDFPRNVTPALAARRSGCCFLVGRNSGVSDRKGVVCGVTDVESDAAGARDAADTGICPRTDNAPS